MRQKTGPQSCTTAYKTFKGIYVSSIHTYFLCDIYEINDAHEQYYNIHIYIQNDDEIILTIKRIEEKWKITAGEAHPELESKLKELLDFIIAEGRTNILK
jgi:hypothetical protein